MKLATIAVLTAFALPAFAQTTSTLPIDQRQADQQQRIEQGVDTGQLTPHETKRLEKGQAKVQKLENKATVDGQVTATERARIQAAQNKQSRKIDRQVNDRQISN